MALRFNIANIIESRELGSKRGFPNRNNVRERQIDNFQKADPYCNYECIRLYLYKISICHKQKIGRYYK